MAFSCVSTGFIVFLFVVQQLQVEGADVKEIRINNLIDGYYWRDYKGHIPKDALPAGKDSTCNTTFIGVALHPGGHLTPGLIHKGNDKVFYEFGGVELAATEDVKIFCTQRPESLKWIKVQDRDPTTGINAIIAGHDDKGPLAIGRKQRANSCEMALGKVLLIGDEFQNIYTAQKGRLVIDSSYEVLVYHDNALLQEAGADTVPNKEESASKIVNINVYWN